MLSRVKIIFIILSLLSLNTSLSLIKLSNIVKWSVSNIGDTDAKYLINKSLLSVTAKYRYLKSSSASYVSIPFFSISFLAFSKLLKILLKKVLFDLVCLVLQSSSL